MRQHTQRATPRSAQNWLRASCPDNITKNQWPPNSSNINSMDYHIWDASAELKEALQVICGNLPQGPIDKAVKDFSNKVLEAGVVAWSWQ